MKDDNYICLCILRSQLGFDLLVSYLEGNGVKVFSDRAQIPENHYSGVTPAGLRVFVLEDQLAQAKDLLEKYSP